MLAKSRLGGLLCIGLPLLTLSACENGPGSMFGDQKIEVKETAYPEKVLWGDTHLHSENSPDAFGFGNRLPPEDALRFARGEEVTSTMGVKAKLARPLDFLLISDHSDGLGFTKRLADAPRFLLPNDTLKRWHDMFNGGPDESTKAMNEMIDMAGDPEVNKSIADPKDLEEDTRSIWSDFIETVEDYDQPGKFTALLGFEYTAMPDGNNLHRVVMFRDGADKAGQVTPFPATIGPRPDQLWDYMDGYEKKTGGRVLAIPHNSNVSNGLMFQMTGPGGQPMTAAEAKRRARLEPVVEATQIKGDSEAHPFLSPNDEFAGYGTRGWDKANLNAKQPTTPDMYGGNYVREALKRGLAIAQRTGENPYKVGMVGSTDSHTSLATADEDNFFGKHTGNEPTSEGRDRVTPAMNLGSRLGRFNWNYLASGYAAVWATANTRKAIWDAFARREVYATTGPRMTVRLFGGWDFSADDFQKDWVKEGYSRGVPMGGDLKAANGKAPSFIVSALKDPDGANLDRVQIVKGWTDEAGNTQEKVFDIVWSEPEKRKVSGGKVPDVGNTVDLKTAKYYNDIGAPELQTVWTDPEFDPAVRAFYYVRVIEIPTPRWVLYDAVRYKLNLPEEIDLVSQERAYTSPIWYSPSA
ncbi:DUF3604 domain-containing protein [Parasphingorhabdus halotolerans]|uniref:DUF3604 domain-containing protein n=1 Tax=Parasphingorhabdus halotolerans TaxID=2725558 RepID=A0A6H2DJE0_9SPHN|nr:DUF3604 domain-containing protein [Parasphingorhabdus halotolerans]QJB68792.1 DUF3604 domain-containing protein [Parasphingorhabdus halotolerans]